MRPEVTVPGHDCPAKQTPAAERVTVLEPGHSAQTGSPGAGRGKHGGLPDCPSSPSEKEGVTYSLSAPQTI